MSSSACELVNTIIGMRARCGSVSCSSSRNSSPFSGEIEIEKDEIRPRSVLVSVLLVQEFQRLDPVIHHVERIGDVTLVERLLGESDVARIILDQQDIGRITGTDLVTHRHHLRLEG